MHYLVQCCLLIQYLARNIIVTTLLLTVFTVVEKLSIPVTTSKKNSLADSICLAIDAMGGDFGPRATVPAVVSFLRQYRRVRAIVFGDQAQIDPLLNEALPDHNTDISSRFCVRHFPQMVEMDEKPSSAIRNKRDSSLWHALGAVADGEADACVSAGNTGALMGMSMIRIKTFDGISRPAICTLLPTVNGQAYMLDVGANIDCSPSQLHQFARMASKLVSVVESIPFPTVGLLNVGSEESKGGENLEECAKLLTADNNINYHGFIEGDDVYLGKTDVIVTDGFTGNVVLKASEGMAKMMAHRLTKAFQRNLATKFIGVLSLPVLRSFKRDVDPDRYNGASLLGLRGIVVKSHGSADKDGFEFAIKFAMNETRENLPKQIQEALL
jgi:glycerol-3-phosphate acyltransferase PlsX